jgi:AsmA protein
VAGKVADSGVKARVAVAGFTTPAVNFDVEIDHLDVDRYFPPAPAGQKQKEPEKPLDLTALRDLRASGTVRIGSLKASNLKATNVRLEVKANGGRVDVSPLTANLYQGTLASAISINAAPAAPTFAVKHNMSGINIAPLLKDLADNDTLEGRGNVSLDVTTQGATESALKKALNGKAALKLVDGAVKGIDIAGAIRGAKARLGSLRGEQTQQADKAQKTDFSELTATFNIRNGVAHNNDLSLKSPLLRVGGEGSIDIGNDSLDYLVKASIVATSKGQGGRDLTDLAGITVPVRATGPLAAPSYKLDFGSMVTDVAKQKVQDAVKGQVEKRLGGVLGGALGGGAAKGEAPKGEAPKGGEKPRSGSAPGDAARDALRGIFGR